MEEYYINLDETDVNDFTAELEAAKAVRAALYAKFLEDIPKESLLTEPEVTPKLIDKIHKAASKTLTLKDCAIYSGMTYKALLHILGTFQTLANEVDELQLPAIEDELRKYAEAQMSRADIAKSMGIEDTDFKDLLARFPHLDRFIMRCANTLLADVANRGMTLARNGDGNMIRFVLERKAGWVKTDKVEISGPGGGPLATTIKKATREEADQAYAKLMRGDAIE